jgi:putative MFS transporter
LIGIFFGGFLGGWMGYFMGRKKLYFVAPVLFTPVFVDSALVESGMAIFLCCFIISIGGF